MFDLDHDHMGPLGEYQNGSNCSQNALRGLIISMIWMKLDIDDLYLTPRGHRGKGQMWEIAL